MKKYLRMPNLNENAWMTLGFAGAFALVGVGELFFINLAIAVYYFWLDHKKLVIEDAEGPYLTRWHLLKTPWFRVFLHHIHRADKDRDPHNHPWPLAFAFVLMGGYREKVTELDGDVRVSHHYNNIAGSISWRAFRPGRYHRITDVLPNTWTLFVAGPRSRDWGFLDGNNNHVPCRQYLGLPENHDFGD